MNYGMIFFILGWVLNVQAAFMLLPCLVALIYGEPCGQWFLVSMGLCLLFGIPMVLSRPSNPVFYTAEGFVAVALSWILLSVTGALPFLWSGSIESPVDALFEMVSGFTTTGASILTDVESLPKCMLFWRSFSHWIGGMGVLVFLLCLLPMTGGGFHMNLLKTESPGPSVSRLLPRVQNTAKALYLIYIGLTVLQLVLLLAGRMPLFDALAITFGTAGTGGFGVRNSSMTYYSPYIRNVVTVFMILFGINFNFYFFLLMGKFRRAFQSEEVRVYLAFILASIAIITVSITPMYGGIERAFHHAAFQVASIITTTGYVSTNFDDWPEIPRTVLLVLMFVGSCAGSTGGGIKISRVLILIKSVYCEIMQFLHPQIVRKIRIDGKPVDSETVRSIYVFMAAYLLVFVVSLLLISADGFDLVTNFTAVAAAFNDVGLDLGLGIMGPTGNFSSFGDFSKVVLIFDMLASRLEIFPMLILFSRETWRRF